MKKYREEYDSMEVVGMAPENLYSYLDEYSIG